MGLRVSNKPLKRLGYHTFLEHIKLAKFLETHFEIVIMLGNGVYTRKIVYDFNEVFNYIDETHLIIDDPEKYWSDYLKNYDIYFDGFD